MKPVRNHISFGQAISNYLIAFYQTQRKAFIVIVTLLLALYILTVPDQATDMINAVIYTGTSSLLFLFILFSTLLWAWVVYGSTRLILHISSVGLRLTPECDWLLRWLPKMGGVIPPLILAYAFRQSNQWHPYWLLLESMGLLLLFVVIERQTSVFALPASWTFLGRYTNLTHDFRILWQHKLGRRVVQYGLSLTGLTVLSFCLPIELGIARLVRPTAITILGIAVYTFWGSLLIYFNDNRYRPLVLLVVGYLILVSAVNDNTAVRQAPLLQRPTIPDHFRRWIIARQQEDQDTIPLVLVAAEGGGIRALNWTAETLIRLDSIIPGFSRHVYALSGASGGSVGEVFYTAFLRDIAEPQRSNQSDSFRSVIRDDYLSAVSAAMLFPDGIQRFLPVPVANLERSKWLEDAWSDSYVRNLRLHTLDSSLTSLYQSPTGYNYSLPSLFLNGTMAESGQKVITSNLQLDPQYFTDVISILDWLGADVPLKTAASLSSRFPILTNGALVEQPSSAHSGGHVVDGGYFDNTGIETCIQLLNALVPLIRQVNTEQHVVVIPYILFIKNSNTFSQLPQKKSVLQEVQIPLLAFLNAWNNGSTTRDNMFNSFMDRFANPKTNYLTIRLAYKDPYPLGWFLSDSMARSLSRQAKDSISLNNKELARLKATFRRMGVTPIND